MTTAEKLRAEGYGKSAFTKEELLEKIVSDIKLFNYCTFTIGTHIGSDIPNRKIGDCNPANRQLFEKTIDEEGFKRNHFFNSYGVEFVRVYL